MTGRQYLTGRWTMAQVQVTWRVEHQYPIGAGGGKSMVNPRFVYAWLRALCWL